MSCNPRAGDVELVSSAGLAARLPLVRDRNLARNSIQVFDGQISSIFVASGRCKLPSSALSLQPSLTLRHSSSSSVPPAPAALELKQRWV